MGGGLAHYGAGLIRAVPWADCTLQCSCWTACQCKQPAAAVAPAPHHPQRPASLSGCGGERCASACCLLACACLPLGVPARLPACLLACRHACLPAGMCLLIPGNMAATSILAATSPAGSCTNNSLSTPPFAACLDLPCCLPGGGARAHQPGQLAAHWLQPAIVWGHRGLGVLRLEVLGGGCVSGLRGQEGRGQQGRRCRCCVWRWQPRGPSCMC